MKHKRLLLICILAACFALATQAWAAQNPPTNVQAAPGNTQAAVSFTAPAPESGSVIIGYDVESNPAGGVDNSANTTSVFHIITGLTNGVAYTFTVKAINNLSGPSAASSPSNSVTPSATAYAAYVGTWNVAGMITGLSAPWGQTCVQTLSADGSYPLECTTASGQTVNTQCTAWLFPYGMTATCDATTASDFVCYGNTAAATASVMACTGTLSGGAYLAVGVKQGSGYSLSSLNNTYWFDEGLAIDLNNPDYWEEATGFNGSTVVSISSSTATATAYKSKNGGQTSAIPSGTLSLESTTGLLQDNFSNTNYVDWYLDSGKTVAAGFTGYDPTDEVELNILTKRAGTSSYSLSDVAGYWVGNKLRSDGSWQRMIIEVNPDGTFVTAEIGSDGQADSGSGQIAITSGGLLSCVSGSCASSGLNAVMDASKTVMTETEASNGGTTPSILILTKVNSPWPNAVNNKGTMELGWFGDFNTTYAPWIYHAKLGWVYPSIGGISPADGCWFYDLQWDKGAGGWWYTSQSLFPWVYSYTDKGWFYFIAASSSPGARLFFDWNTQQYVSR